MFDSDNSAENSHLSEPDCNGRYKSKINSAELCAGIQLYGALHRAFEHFNKQIFDSKLPQVVITLAAKGKSSDGYLRVGRFERHDGLQRAGEISINPKDLSEPLATIMLKLVHNMTHLWQHCFGKQSRGGYHNAQWSEKMRSLGLTPTDTGTPGGKDTGQKISQLVVAGGQYETALQLLIDSGFEIEWQLAIEAEAAKKTGSSSGSSGRTRWDCPHCNQHVWAAASATVLCGRCSVPFVPHFGETSDLPATF